MSSHYDLLLLLLPDGNCLFIFFLINYLFFYLFKIEEMRLKADEELKKELSRQAAAHNNHLTLMLRIQQNELSDYYEK